jgi:hypothetical protein
VEADEGTVVTIEVGGQEKITDAVTWSMPMAFTVGTDEKVDPMIAGRIISVRFSSDHEKSWGIIGYDLEIQPLGVY